MNRVVLMFLLVSCVSADSRSERQSVYVSRKSRSNSAPVETGYVYSQVNNHPGTMTMFASDSSDYNSQSLNHYSDYPLGGPPKYFYKKSASMVHPSVKENISPYTPQSIPSYEYLKAKAETKYESNFLPAKLKSDAMYEKLKSLMHYKYPDDGSVNDNYDSLSDYHVDEDDVRTSSRTTYDNWPYFYHSPYEYEAIKMGYDKEKAKDKRYVGTPNDIIPVHEEVDDVPQYNIQPVTTIRYNRDMTTDNPIYGDQPFFSFVLNDYFDKNNEDDSLVFKGLDWGKEFDREHNLSDVDDYLKRNRRLGNHYSNPPTNHYRNNNVNSKINHDYDSKFVAADSTTEKGYNNNHEFNKRERGDEHNENHKSAYENSGNNYRGFKDFADTFANRFGGENHKKDAKYVLKQDQDKGEKKKGFRRVYHKDEYQEEDEFYDNSNRSAKAEEKGGSSVHHGGSDALLKSQSAAAIANEGSAYNNAGNANRNKFENNHSGNELSKGYNNEFNRYRDVAKKAALSNSADYIDNYRVQT